MGLIRALVQHGSALVSAKLGRCSKCMGLSLAGAILGWVVVAAVLVYLPRFEFANLLILWPASFTALWFLHITTFATRGVISAYREESSSQAPNGAGFTTFSRRRAVAMFGSGVAFAAFLSLAAGPMRAFGACGASTCCGNVGGPCAGCQGSVCVKACKFGCSSSNGGPGGICVPKHLAGSVAPC